MWSEVIEGKLGKIAAFLAMMGEEVAQSTSFIKEIRKDGYLYIIGRVGSMEPQKVVAAIETAAKNQGIIDHGVYREAHALYHAIIESLHGIGRGDTSLGSIMRTVGLTFAVVRGKPYPSEEEGEWIAVALYGTIGAPIKGSEHEVLGMGINHI